LRAFRCSAAFSAFCLLIPELAAQLIVETRRLGTEHPEMQERIDVNDEDDKGCQRKIGFERQFDIEEGKFDGTHQQKIFMGDGARRDRDVGKDREIGEPQPPLTEA
jgi:hypothetical protein